MEPNSNSEQELPLKKDGSVDERFLQKPDRKLPLDGDELQRFVPKNYSRNKGNKIRSGKYISEYEKKVDNRVYKPAEPTKPVPDDLIEELMEQDSIDKEVEEKIAEVVANKDNMLKIVEKKDFSQVASNEDFTSEEKDFTLQKLTLKQAHFVKEFVRNGGNKYSAYVTAYKSTISKPAILENASKILLLPHIREALKAEIIALKSIEKIDKSFVVECLKEMALECRESKNYKFLIESLNMMCRIAGFYQTQNTVNQLNITKNTEVHFGDFSMESKFQDDKTTIQITDSGMSKILPPPTNNLISDSDETFE